MKITTVTTAKLDQITKAKPTLPKSWYKAAGLLRHKRKALNAHTIRVHQEWSLHNKTP